MGDAWIAKETNSHQDHVIAHVLGAKALAYIVLDEVLYLLLDIGFVWNIFLDGEMGLLPHPVAVAELEVESETKEQIKADIDALLGARSESLRCLSQLPVACEIREVGFFAAEDRRLLLLTGEPGSLEIEMSLGNRTIHVRAGGQQESRRQ